MVLTTYLGMRQYQCYRAYAHKLFLYTRHTFCYIVGSCCIWTELYVPSTEDCEPCPAGYLNEIIHSNTECFACDPGYYFNGNGDGLDVWYGGSECTACGLGHYCPGPGFEPIPCPAGKYTELHVTWGCWSCEPGEYQPSTGQTRCRICPAGSYTTAYTQTSCWPCPEGKYCSGGSHNAPCPAGQYSVSGASQCSACNSGYYCPGGTNQIPCSPGYYCPSNWGSSQTPCSVGYYAPSEFLSYTIVYRMSLICLRI